MHIDRTQDSLTELTNKLCKGEYTILNVFQDNDRKITLYTLGKVKK